MTPTEALKNLAKFLHGKPALQVATVARGVKADDPPDTRALNLAGDAKQHFQTAIATSVTANIDPLQWSLKKYDPVYKPEQGGVEVEWVKTVDVASMGLALDRVKNLGGLAGFDPSDQGYLKRLAYWAGVLTNADASDAAYFFRSFTASAELKRKSKVALVLRAGTFHLVEERIFFSMKRLTVSCMASTYLSFASQTSGVSLIRCNRYLNTPSELPPICTGSCPFRTSRTFKMLVHQIPGSQTRYCQSGREIISTNSAIQWLSRSSMSLV
jgi:hypothetical protein